MSCTTVTAIRAVWPAVDPDTAIPDAEIVKVIDEVCPLYAGQMIATSKHRPDAINLHVCHVLWLTLNSVAAGPVPFGAPVAEADLEGVGKLKFAVANVNPGDLIDLLKIPSPYLARLLMKRRAMVPSVAVV